MQIWKENWLVDIALRGSSRELNEKPASSGFCSKLPVPGMQVTASLVSVESQVILSQESGQNCITSIDQICI